MDMGKFCAEEDRIIDNLCDRSMLRRLWDSYADDMLLVLQWQKEGKCSQAAVSRAIARIVPVMAELADDARLAEALRRAEAILVHKVLEDITPEQDPDQRPPGHARREESTEAN